MAEGEQGASGAEGAGDAAAVAAAAAAAEGKPSGSALDLPPEGEDKRIVAPVDWPDDWRVKIAGEDKDALKRLERFKQPGDIYKSFIEIEKLRGKGFKADDPMPDPEKDADGAKAWRKERGIPDDPTGYELPKPVQERMTDADKPVLSSFTEFAHKKGLPPNAVAAAAEWYVDMNDQLFQQAEAADVEQAGKVQDDLRQELGKEYRPFTTVAKRMAEEVTPGINWFEARLPPEPGFPHGRKLSNIPEFVRALGEMGMQKYGDVAFAGGEAATRTQTRKAEIENIRDTDFSRYDNDKAMQKEYQGILEAEENRGAKR